MSQGVSGTYHGECTGRRLKRLELRVDVDGPFATNRLSGDFFVRRKGEWCYADSFIVDRVRASGGPGKGEWKISGWCRIPELLRHKFVAAEGGRQWTPHVRPGRDRDFRIQVVIPNPTRRRSQANVRLVFPKGSVSDPNGSTVDCQCRFSPRFRQVSFEQDWITKAKPVRSCMTRGGKVTICGAYQAAGIDMRPVQRRFSGTVATDPRKSSKQQWSDAELYAAMRANFSRRSSALQWSVYQLVVPSGDAGLKGSMFDWEDDHPRQGCAVFEDTFPHDRRRKMRIIGAGIHEVGHCFNLHHPWEENITPPVTAERQARATLTWMNCPEGYHAKRGKSPGNDEARAAHFWDECTEARSAGPEFTRRERIHLRHGFRDDIIFGGSSFVGQRGMGAAAADGLELRVRCNAKGFLIGEPVVVEVRLSTRDRAGKMVHSHLHPKYGLVQLSIQRLARKGPNPAPVAYRPLVRYSVDTLKLEKLAPKGDDDEDALYASAYIGFGRGGFYFADPGTYAIRALYTNVDGAQVASKPCQVAIRRPPAREAARHMKIARRLMRPQIGRLLCLRGLPPDEFESCHAALQRVLPRKHSLALYADLAKGLHLEKDFKTVAYTGRARRIEVIPAKPERSVRLLERAVGTLLANATAGKKDRFVDYITLKIVMFRLAQAFQKLDRKKQGAKKRSGLARADKVLRQMEEFFLFSGRIRKYRVIKTIEKEIADKREELGIKSALPP